jgi:hypothetical protein
MGQSSALIPASAPDPLAGLSLSRRCRDHRDNFIPVPCVTKVEDHLGIAEIHEMSVSFYEPGNRKPALQVDHFRRRSELVGHLRIRSNQANPSVGNRNGGPLEALRGPS